MNGCYNNQEPKYFHLWYDFPYTIGKKKKRKDKSEINLKNWNIKKKNAWFPNNKKHNHKKWFSAPWQEKQSGPLNLAGVWKLVSMG